MIPLILYLSTPPVPGLLLSYPDFRLELATWIGYGADSTYWELTNPGSTADLHRSVQECYRWVLYPQTIPGENVNHVWSFLKRTGSLTFQAGEYEYDTPTNFASFVGEFMWWDSPSTASTKIRKVEIDELLSRRQYLQTSMAYPQLFATDWNPASLGASQTQKFVFHPTPSAATTVNYRYAVNAEPLSMSNPYPVGGQRISQLMLEAARAHGEFRKNGTRGGAWEVFLAALDSAIRMDKNTNTSNTVGFMSPMNRRCYDPYLGESQLYDVDGVLVTTGA